MKITTKFFVIFSILFSTTIMAKAQCNVSAYTKKCVDKYVKPKGFQFLKSYKLDGHEGEKTKITYSYVFSRGTTYLITLANAKENSKGVTMTLLSPSRKKMATSYSEKQKKNFPVRLRCQRTGIYYLRYTFNKDSGYCAASVLGFKR